jgi:hypothetical protein
MKNFPNMVLRSVDDLYVLARYILKERNNDVNDFNNLKNIFMSGRKVGRIPTDSLDVLSSDRIGDMNYDDAYIYILIDNAGTPEWRRAGLGSW